MREDLSIAKRIVYSYKLMLDFYGLELVSEQTGEVQRCIKNWRARYRNLNTCFHNNLRITRILTSLGELGFSRYKKALVDHFTEEILENGHLETCARSLFKHWNQTLNIDSKEYIEKTLESSGDREDSIFFKQITNNENTVSTIDMELSSESSSNTAVATPTSASKSNNSSTKKPVKERKKK